MLQRKIQNEMFDGYYILIVNDKYIYIYINQIEIIIYGHIV